VVGAVPLAGAGAARIPLPGPGVAWAPAAVMEDPRPPAAAEAPAAAKRADVDFFAAAYLGKLAGGGQRRRALTWGGVYGPVVAHDTVFASKWNLKAHAAAGAPLAAPASCADLAKVVVHPPQPTPCAGVARLVSVAATDALATLAGRALWGASGFLYAEGLCGDEALDDMGALRDVLGAVASKTPALATAAAPQPLVHLVFHLLQRVARAPAHWRSTATYVSHLAIERMVKDATRRAAAVALKPVADALRSMDLVAKELTTSRAGGARRLDVATGRVRDFAQSACAAGGALVADHLSWVLAATRVLAVAGHGADVFCAECAPTGGAGAGAGITAADYEDDEDDGGGGGDDDTGAGAGAAGAVHQPFLMGLDSIADDYGDKPDSAGGAEGSSGERSSPSA